MSKDWKQERIIVKGLANTAKEVQHSSGKRM